ncbi:MAG: hypothetical protein EP335_03160, partial [Alphaproteobacteria bacterium]
MDDLAGRVRAQALAGGHKALETDAATTTGSAVDTFQPGTATDDALSGTNIPGSTGTGAVTGETGAQTGEVNANGLLDGIDDIRDILVFADNNTLVDTLLMGKQYAEDAEGGTYTLTFSFPDSESVYYGGSGYGSYGEPGQAYYALSDAAQDFFRATFDMLSQYTNLVFVEVEETATTAGTIRPVWTDYYLSGAAAWGYYPWDSQSAGDMWFSTYNMSEDQGDFETILLHELGHALGLKHTFSSYGTFSAVPYEYDGWDYSVMAYDESARYPGAYSGDLSPQTFMMLDIMALQHLYGTNYNATAGDDSYIFDLGQRYFQTIWDAGGTDTIGITGGNTDVELNLTTGGGWLNVGTTITYYGSYQNWQETDTVYLMQGAVIENAYGAGGNDIISGNNADNMLEGNAGNDTLAGGEGSDTLVGGAGADTFRFGDSWGNDTITDFEDGTDSILLEVRDLHYDDLSITQDGDDVLVSDGNGNMIRLTGVTASDLTEADIVNLFDGAVFTGTSCNDELHGDIGDDTIYGLGGRDSLYGEDGNDLIEGGDGVDTLVGANGDDTLLGGADNDYLGGGAGDDSLDGGAGDDRLDGGNNNDTIIAGDGSDSAYGGAGDDSIVGDSGSDTLNGGDGDDTLEGGDGNDFIYVGYGNDSATGGNGDDSIRGDRGDDHLSGGNGADTLDAGYGSDTIWGEDGNDYLTVNPVQQDGQDYMFGGHGDDTLLARGGTSLLNGGNGNDRLYMYYSYAGMTLEGGAGADFISPGYEEDIIDFGEDSDGDFVQGHASNLRGDTISNFGAGDYVEIGYFNDTSTGAMGIPEADVSEVGNDDLLTISLPDVNQTIEITLTGHGHSVELVDGGDHYFLVNMSDSRAYTNYWGGMNHYGEAGAETITGGANSDGLFGGGGNDSLVGGNGDDTLAGSCGDDTLDGGNGGDRLVGGCGDDQLLGGLGSDTLFSGDGADTVMGGAGADTIWSGADGDLVDAGDDGDFIHGGTGADTLYGGAGNDTITEAEYALSNGDADDLIDGGEGNDFLFAGGGADTLYGGNGDDTMQGGDDNDWLEGGEGWDYLSGGDGVDTLYGGEQNDTLGGGAGNDYLFGGNGDDILGGDFGNDILDGGAGDDTLSGYRGNDVFAFGVDWGTDSILSFCTDEDYISIIGTGLTAADMTIAWQDGALQMSDGAGNSVIFYDLDASDIPNIRIIDRTEYIGTAGADTLEGSLLDDTFTGGAGADVFRPGVLWGDDTITDFCADDDLIDVRAIGVFTMDDLTIIQQGADTVITFGANDSITLTGVNASDLGIGNFVLPTFFERFLDNYAPWTDQPDPGTTPTTVHYMYSDLWDDTTLSASNELVIESFYGFSAGDGVNVVQQGTFWVGAETDDMFAIRIGTNGSLVNSGTLVVAGPYDASGIVIYGGTDIANSGSVYAVGNDIVYGVETASRVVASFDNSGLISAWSENAAYGVEFEGNSFTNSGIIEAVGQNRSFGVMVGIPSTAFSFTNTGTITATSAGNVASSYGIYASWEGDYSNDGTVQGFYSFFSAAPNGSVSLANTGTLLGNVATGSTSDEISNTGQINGFVRLGGGNDTFASADGHIFGLIDGGTGDDSIVGSVDGDLIYSGSGADTLTGGEGGDRFVLSGTGNVITDFNTDVDTIDISSYGTGQGYQISHTGNDNFLEFFVGDALVARLLDVSLGDFYNWFAQSHGASVVSGSLDDDTINGTAAADYMLGMSGDDSLRGGSNDDTLIGSDGNDSLYGNAGDDYLEGGIGFDSLHGGDGDDRINGGAGDDLENGGAGQDTLLGGDGNDTLFGHDNADSIVGGTGDDYMTGGSGGDVFAFGAGWGNDTIADFSGADQIDLFNAGVDYFDLSIHQQGADVLIADGNGNSILVMNADEGDFTPDALWIYYANPFFGGDSGNNTVAGSSNDDIIFGFSGNDALLGYRGADTISGGAGHDTIQGGAGADSIDGGAGSDQVYYGSSSAAVTVDLSVGTGTGGDAEGDTYVNVENVFGSLYGDSLVGDSGRNALYGNTGDDTLDGGAGNDWLYGQGGADTFVFGAGWGQDIIRDYVHGTDQIDL